MTHPFLYVDRHSNSLVSDEEPLPEWITSLVHENNQPLKHPLKYGELNNALRTKIAR